MNTALMLYEEEMKILSSLPVETIGVITKALMASSLGNDIPELDDMSRAIFELINRQITRARELSEKRSEIGKKGLKNRWNDSKPIANDSKPIANDSKPIANDSTNTNTNTNTNKKTKEKESCEEEAEKSALPKIKPLEGVPYDEAAYCVIYENPGMLDFCPKYKPYAPAEIRLLQELGRDYPSVNLVAEFRRARDWLANAPPSKRKKDLRAFLRNWISRAYESLPHRDVTVFVPTGEGMG